MADFITLNGFNSVDGLVHGFGTAFADSQVGGFADADSFEELERKKDLTLQLAAEKAADISGDSFDAVFTILQCQRDNLLVIDKELDENYLPAADCIRCDGIITNRPGLLIGIKTADCLPILISDPVNRVIAAVHAGWLGSYKRIMMRAVKRMQNEFGSEPANLQLAMGPSARSCCYEVGEEFLERFSRYKEQVLRADEDGQLFFDNVKYNQLQANALGIKPENIHVCDNCTMCDTEESFYSYRKHGDHCGRMLSFIGISK